LYFYFYISSIFFSLRQCLMHCIKCWHNHIFFIHSAWHVLPIYLFQSLLYHFIYWLQCYTSGLIHRNILCALTNTYRICEHKGKMHIYTLFVKSSFFINLPSRRLLSMSYLASLFLKKISQWNSHWRHCLLLFLTYFPGTSISIHYYRKVIQIAFK
jgi:hypothetical protein